MVGEGMSPTGPVFGFTLVPVTPEQLALFSAGKSVLLAPRTRVDWPREDRRVLRYRREALDVAPASWMFLLHAAVGSDGVLLGRIGCHGGPDEDGEVEIGYYVVPAWRGRGVAGQIVDAFLTWISDRGVRGVRASVGPHNTPSIRLLERRGFSHVAERWDDEDGSELVYRRDLP